MKRDQPYWNQTCVVARESEKVGVKSKRDFLGQKADARLIRVFCEDGHVTGASRLYFPRSSGNKGLAPNTRTGL